MMMRDGRGPAAAPAWRLVLLLAMIGIGWGLSHALDPSGTLSDGIAGTAAYLYGATALLAIGLYSSTTQISGLALRRLADSVRRAIVFRPVFSLRPIVLRPIVLRPEDRVSVRIVFLAVTVGVVVKAALITAVMYVAFREPLYPLYLVLGVAMAQIDPLSVVALRGKSELSERAKAILHAWSSFDDPVTMLLTIYLAALALSGNLGLVGADLMSFSWNLLANLGFAAAAAIIWWVLSRIAGMPKLSDSDSDEQVDSDDGKKTGLPPGLNLVAVVVLATLVIVAVWQFLILGLAIAGLYFRPRLGPWLNRATQVALLLASLMLGVLLLGHVAWWHGLWLGVAAFAAQVVVALTLTRKLSFPDRGFLALSQQSGITAIILALLLERSFAGTVAVVAPAIIVINILHVCSTAVFSKIIQAPIIWILAPQPAAAIIQPPVVEAAESSEINADSTRSPKSLNASYVSASLVDPNVWRNPPSSLPIDTSNSSNSVSRNSGRTS